MICNLFLRMRTHGEYADDPACGVVELNTALFALLTQLDVAAHTAKESGAFSVSFLCGFSVYDDSEIPDDPIWERIIARLEDHDPIVVWTEKSIPWTERASDVCLAISYGKGNIVFQSSNEYGGGCTESDFIAMSDLRDYWKEQYVPSK